MPAGPLFAKYDIHSVIENRKAHMVEKYKILSDEDALNEEVIKALKQQYLLDIPVLRPTTEMWAEEGTTRIDARRLPNRIYFDTSRPIMEEVPEYIVHAPFDGDPRVFDIAPSAYNSRIAVGEVVGQEVILRTALIMPEFNIQSEIDNQISQINWALRSLRESMAYFDQELEIAIRQAIQTRRRAIDSRAQSKATLNIPIRPAPRPPPVSIARPSPHSQAEQVRKQMKSAAQDKWDVFISHASEDKPYVEQLVAGLGSAGVTVWLDSPVLRWGWSLREAIDEGLKKSRFVIVILSKAFLIKKKWTEYELSSAFALETVDDKRILPIWHGITLDDLKGYSPGLTDRLARESDKHSFSAIANELLILLNRRPAHALPIESNEAPPAPSVSASNAGKGETVAYIWYWTKEGKIAGLYVRKAAGKEGIFTLEEPDGTIHEGNADEIAAKYVASDKRFQDNGLKRSSVMGSSEYPQFNPSH